MKNIIQTLILGLITLLTANCFAFTPPDVPANGWYVLDQANKLSDDQKTSLNQKIENLNKTTKNEYAIAILSSLEGEDIAQAAQDTFTKWGVGKKGLDNGVMIMISVGDRKTRIQTGKGIESDLPDLYCNDVLQQTLKPHLKKGQFYEGLDATLDALSSHVESRVDAKPLIPATQNENSSSNIGFGIFVVCLILIGLFTIIAFMVSFFQNRKFEKIAKKHQNDWDNFRANNRTTYSSFDPIPPPPVYSSHHTSPYTAPKSTNSGLKTAAVATAAGIGAGVAYSAITEASRHHKAEERAREEKARKRRLAEEEAKNNRRRSSYSSSYDSGSSYSSYDSGSSFDSGGSGFDGGGSCGGGSSGDF